MCVDGFLLDRGFQVLNPAYTELRKAVDRLLVNTGNTVQGLDVRGDYDPAKPDGQVLDAIRVIVREEIAGPVVECSRPWLSRLMLVCRRATMTSCVPAKKAM